MHSSRMFREKEEKNKMDLPSLKQGLQGKIFFFINKMTKSLKLYAGSINYFQLLCVRKTVS